jgi:hypothetical protein
MGKEHASSGGVGFLGLLALVFITLKLTGVIAWSWLWVLAPLWGPLAIGLGILLVAAVIMGIIWLLTKLADLL